MEEDIKVQICRLCFSLISDNDFLQITGSLKDMLQVITTDLDLDVTDSPVMCSECSKSVQDLFSFKTNFFESEEKIEEKVADRNVKLDLADIMSNSSHKRVRRRPSKVKLEKHKMCRLCLKKIKGERFIPLDKNADVVLGLLLDTCLSELDLNLTSEPVMCTTCNEVLQKMYIFKTMCTENENKVHMFLKTLGTDYHKKVNLYSMVQFVSNLEKKSNIPTMKTESLKCEELVENIGNFELIEDRKIQDCLKYVTAKIESGSREVEVEQENKLNEKYDTGSSCLELMGVKKEPTDQQCSVTQETMNIEKNLIELNDNNEGEDELINHKSQRIRCSKEIAQNRATDGRTSNTTHCRYCNFKTKYSYNLKRHKFAFHKCHLAVENLQQDVKKRRYFPCPHCEFSAKFDIDLTRHMLSHVKPGAFQCKRCPYSTNQNSHLVKHILSHVNDDNKDKRSVL